MKKILITAMALMALLLAAQGAQAAQVTGEIKVVAYGQGMLISTGIECGSGRTDCTESKTWDDAGPAPEMSLYPHPTKTGWGITSWSGCTRLASMNDCRVTYPSSGTKTVFAFFMDVQNPSVFIAGYSARAGDSLHVNLQVSDNEKLTKVEFLLDDQVVLTQTENFGDALIDTSQVPEGDHVLSVRATDGNYNVGRSNSHTIPVDHTAPEILLIDPVEQTDSASPAFTFDSPGDDYWNSDCAIQRQGETDELTPCGRNQPYSEEGLTDGTWEFVVQANDSAGNVRRVVHTFVVELPTPVDEDPDPKPDPNPDPKPDPKPDPDPDPGQEPGPDAADRAAPVVKLVAPRRQTLGTAGKALRLNVRCDEACSGRVVVKGKGVRFAGRVLLSGAGVAKLKLRPTAKVRKRLATMAARSLRTVRSPALKLTAGAVLTDKAGNSGKASLKFRVAS